MGEAKRIQKRLQELQRYADSGKLIDCRELHGLKVRSKLSLEFAKYPKAPYILAALKAGETVVADFELGPVILPGSGNASRSLKVHNILELETTVNGRKSSFLNLPWTGKDTAADDEAWFAQNANLSFRVRKPFQVEAELARLTNGWEPIIFVVKAMDAPLVISRYAYPVAAGYDFMAHHEFEDDEDFEDFFVCSLEAQSDFDSSRFDTAAIFEMLDEHYIAYGNDEAAVNTPKRD